MQRLSKASRACVGDNIRRRACTESRVSSVTHYTLGTCRALALALALAPVAECCSMKQPQQTSISATRCRRRRRTPFISVHLRALPASSLLGPRRVCSRYECVCSLQDVDYITRLTRCDTLGVPSWHLLQQMPVDARCVPSGDTVRGTWHSYTLPGLLASLLVLRQSQGQPATVYLPAQPHCAHGRARLQVSGLRLSARCVLPQFGP